MAYFFKVYFRALPGILRKMTVSALVNPREALAFSQSCLNWEDLNQPCRVIGSREPWEAFPVKGDIVIRGAYYDNRRGGTHLLTELAVLAAIARLFRPRIIFEIGTHVGRTGRILLMNSDSNSRLFTLDLPADQCTHSPGADLMNEPRLPAPRS